MRTGLVGLGLVICLSLFLYSDVWVRARLQQTWARTISAN
jgi:hypothetical protein